MRVVYQFVLTVVVAALGGLLAALVDNTPEPLKWLLVSKSNIMFAMTIGVPIGAAVGATVGELLFRKGTRIGFLQVVVAWLCGVVGVFPSVLLVATLWYRGLVWCPVVVSLCAVAGFRFMARGPQPTGGGPGE